MEPTRCSLWLDGCFDGFHYAHANAIRQALFLVPEEKNPRIVVGVHSDQTILQNKGPPLFDEHERYSLIRGCRWIDQVVEDVPYVSQLDIIEKYRIDFVIHGDDFVRDAEGNDCYAAFKGIGKYKECKRTEGISTTSVIERILRPNEWAEASVDEAHLANLLNLFVDAVPPSFSMTYYTDLASSTASREKFCNWPLQRKIVYLGGAWDCFGAGHVELLRRAKEAAGGEDTFLVVGLWSDEILMQCDREKPLLALLERALAVVQCKYTNAIIISAPRTLPPSIISALGIQVMVNACEATGADIECVRVEEPLLLNVASLRAKLVTQLSAYEERQRRKAC